jgi:hypothetical protein
MRRRDVRQKDHCQFVGVAAESLRRLAHQSARPGSKLEGTALFADSTLAQDQERTRNELLAYTEKLFSVLGARSQPAQNKAAVCPRNRRESR